MQQKSPRCAVPWLLIAAIALEAAALAWLTYFGFPKDWGDVVFFKQPAYMALHTGAFSLPTAIGHRPYAEITYAAYPPLYTYASLVMFKLFGFGVRASLAFDASVHLILVALSGWLLWRKTGSQPLAALFVLLTTAFYLPEGRPDELAILLALLAIMATARRRHLVAAGLLGLSLAAQPTQALLGLIICVGIDFAASGPTRRFFARWAAVGAAAGALCLLIWLPAVAPHLPEAVAQFRAHSADRWAPGLGELLARDPAWTLFWAAVVVFVAGCGVFLTLRPPAHLRRDAEDGILLRGILLSMPFCIGYLLLIRSPFYGYRLLNIVYLAGAFYLAHALAHSGAGAGRAGARKAPAGAALAVIVVLAAAMNYNIARFVLAPLTWGADAVTYDQAVATVRRVVPPDATVGGDSVIWWAIDDGRPFYSLTWYMGEPWPDYLLSTSWWGRPNILLRRAWADRLEAEYIEVTPAGAPAESCQLHIFGRPAPLSRRGGSCDWRVRIWKRT